MVRTRAGGGVGVGVGAGCGVGVGAGGGAGGGTGGAAGDGERTKVGLLVNLASAVWWRPDFSIKNNTGYL